MPTEKTLDVQQRKIFYKIIGEGPLVVLLHGLPFDGNLWTPLLTSSKDENNLQASPSWHSPLTDKFKFIIPDLPGSGASEMIDDMSMEGMAEVIKKILDTEFGPTQTPLNEERVDTDKVPDPQASAVVVPSRRDRKGAVIVGHSMGGYVSLAFAAKYPEYLTGLGLFHSTAYPDNEERKLARKKGIESVKNIGAHAFLKTIIQNLFSPNSRNKIGGAIDEFIERTNNFSAEALVSYYKAMMQRPDRSSVLTSLKIPMLIIAGKYDKAAPLNDLLKLCHLPEISYFHILSESGHMGMIEEVEKSNYILNEYLINVS